MKRLIVFDMDGVIIDVSGSYRDTVRQTAKLFFKEALSWKNLPDPLFELEDLAEVKQSGGLNNDWDLSCLVISLMFSLVKKVNIKEIQTGFWEQKSGKEGKGGDKGDAAWIMHDKVISSCDVEGLAKFLITEEKPLTTLIKKKGKKNDKFIMSLYKGDVGSGNIIKQIFQEIYLGGNLFESIYGISPRIHKSDGYIKREKPLIKISFLDALSKDNILAIATGRPKVEADYALEFFNLRGYFSIVLTLDDCIREEIKIMEKEGKKVSFGKPNPFMLDAIADMNKHRVDNYYYVGDMPDDMVAAARSRFGFKGVGFLAQSSNKDILKRGLLESGADYIMEGFEDLKGIIQASET